MTAPALTPAPPPYLDDRSFVTSDTCDAFDNLMDRLETVIEDETIMLRAHRHDGLVEYTRQKRQALLELNRLMRSLDNTIPSQSIMTRLAGFRRRLELNDAALQVELRAVQSVTDTIVTAMRDAESDGTYSRGHGRYADYE